MEKIIGIDLGTSNSAAAVIMGGRPVMIPSAEGLTVGGKMFPSYVAFTKTGELLVGEPARRQAVMNPDGTVMAIKRKMGSDQIININNKEYTPQQISAFILQKIRTDCESFIGEPLKRVVITVPAYFNDNQRTATKEAGMIAGLEVVRIINEPTAAALAYGLDKNDLEQKILVFDFGGGTLDVTIMDCGEGVFEVLSTNGDTMLGGTDMDNAIIDYICKEFEKDHGFDLKNDKMATQRVREAAEKAKIELTSLLETEISLPYISADSNGPKHLIMTLSRSKLEEIVRDIVNRCEISIKQSLDDARLSPSMIDKIILVGGPTRMPIVRKFAESYFGKQIERGIDPMECVAIGAAIQGSVISGEMKEILLLDVIPLSLGVETVGSVFTRVIEKNTTIPTRKNRLFTTSQDNQVNVDINILQGERPMAEDNISLGKFTLTGIPFSPRGVPQIDVTFDIDANGMLHVSAKDLSTGTEQKISISGSTKLSKQQIEKMRKEGEQYAEEDKKKKELAEIRNEAEMLISQSESTITELKTKLSGKEKEELENATKILRTSIDLKKKDVIKEKMAILTRLLHDIATSIYQTVGDSVERESVDETDTGDIPEPESKPKADKKKEEKSKRMGDDSDQYWEDNDGK